MIEEYITRWRERRVQQLERVIERCNKQLATLWPEYDDEDAAAAARLEVARQRAAFKRINHLNKLDKE